jgi:hypothetical protein
MKNIRFMICAAMVVALAFAGVPASAQVVTTLPVAVSASTVKDLGNGPVELKIIQGNLRLFTSQSSGVGSTSGSSTALTLTGTPATPPCVGCILSGTGITSGTTVISFNGTTTVGMSAAMTVASGTAVAWGAACPASIGSVPAANIQAAVGGDWPLYTQARICASAANGPGAVVLPFAIGAH